MQKVIGIGTEKAESVHPQLGTQHIYIYIYIYIYTEWYTKMTFHTNYHKCPILLDETWSCHDEWRGPLLICVTFIRWLIRHNNSTSAFFLIMPFNCCCVLSVISVVGPLGASVTMLWIISSPKTFSKSSLCLNHSSYALPASRSHF